MSSEEKIKLNQNLVSSFFGIMHQALAWQQS